MNKTNVEFIQRIKEKVNPKPGRAYESVMIEVTDMNRLIEQAEYVQDLEDELKNERQCYSNEAERNKRQLLNRIELKKENKRLREELEESNRIKDVMDGHLVRTGQKIIDRENAWAESQYQLRETLEFYADSNNYKANVVDQWAPEIKVMMDGGAKAAELLEGLK